MKALLCVCCYLTQLSYPGNGSLAGVLSIHRVLFEKEEELVVFWVVALRNQVDTNKPGVYGEKQYYSSTSVPMTRLSPLFYTSETNPS